VYAGSNRVHIPVPSTREQHNATGIRQGSPGANLPICGGICMVMGAIRVANPK